MSAPATGIVSWKNGRNFGYWHVTGVDLWTTLCGWAVPMKPLENVSRIRGKDRGPTCSNCLRELEKATKRNVHLMPSNG